MCCAICLATEVLWGMRGVERGLISHFWVSPWSGPARRNFSKTASFVFTYLIQPLFLFPMQSLLLFSEKTFSRLLQLLTKYQICRWQWIGSKVGFYSQHWLCKLAHCKRNGTLEYLSWGHSSVVEHFVHHMHKVLGSNPRLHSAFSFTS